MTDKLDFSSVVTSWDAGVDQNEIHPLGDDEAAYWSSGQAQADQVKEYAQPGAHVLDFGCGNGRITIPLARMGYKVTAADASPKMLDWLNTNAAEAGVTLNAVQSDGDDLAKHLGRKKAEVILARAVLIHHDYAGVERIVTNLASCLKKGGVLICDWPVSAEPSERATWISVTTWDPGRRLAVASNAGLNPVHLGSEPSVWRKA